MLVAVGFLQAVILLLSIMAIYGQIKTAKNSERAWVLVGTTGSPERWYAPDDPSYAPGMVFQFKVYGRTPAVLVKADFKLDSVPVRPGTKPPEPDLPSIPKYSESRNLEIPEGGRVLSPGETFQVRLSLSPPTLTEEQWVKLRDGNTIMCAYGFIEYRDVFERKKEIRVCYLYEFRWGGVIKTPDGTVLNPPGFRIGGPRAYNKVT
jgi:hypothetical protein